MPNIIEKAQSRKTTLDFRQPTMELLYLVTEVFSADPISGADLEDQVRLIVDDTSPEEMVDITGLTLRRTRIIIDPIGGGCFNATVEYKEPSQLDYSFDTTGGSEHRTQSKETKVSIKAGGGTPPDFKQAIGVSHEGVHGVDVVVPKLEFSITQNMDDDEFDLEYLKTIHELTGTVNMDPFLTFDGGELLFLGASGSPNAENQCRVTFKFAASRNKTDIIISDEITIPFKYGWEYVWVYYSNKFSAGKPVLQPEAAYVERMYEYEDFTKLKIKETDT